MSKELLISFFANFWGLLNSIAIFILIGVVLAGVFKLLLPNEFIKKHLGQHNFLSNIKAAILGIPLPLCSCSVIPFVSVLKKSGASKSAIQTFLIATPITGADSILATYGVFGWLFTIYRVVSSVIIALIAGLITLFLVKEDEDKNQNETKILDIKEQKSAQLKKVKVSHIQNKSYSSCSSSGNAMDSSSHEEGSKQGYIKQILSYAFDEIFKDIAKSLMIGVIVGALIITFIPEDLSEYISSNLFLNYALVVIISMPLYVCATASIPVGLSLLSAGFSPGAAFIFLTAGPATNTITMSVVSKTLGKASLVIYLASVFIGSILFGFLFDSFFSGNIVQTAIAHIHEEQVGFIDQVSSVILLYLSFKYIFNKKTKIISSGGCSGCSSSGSCGS